jgi:FAD/FMN-containing dehydrogenase
MDPATNADGRRLEALLKAELPRLRVRLPANDDTNTTLPKGRAAAVVALPASTDQVAAVLRTAGKHGAAVYPVSCGNNWGYGDRLPVRPGGILLDLSGMKAIHEVHPDLGYAVVEPGVTYWDLTAHLARTGLPFWADVTGAGPHTSVLGNTLERGFGHTAHADHYANSAGYEVVLADGTTLTTGFGPAARAAYCHKPGVGPALDGLFSQSNLGVVTRMGVWLQPAPEHHAAFALTATDPAAVGPLVDRLRPLRQLGVAPTCVHIANDYRAASATRRITLTHEGSAFLEDCQRLLADLANAEASVSAGGVKASGHLRITAPAGFGRRHVAPLVPRFRELHVEVTISLNLSDRVVDLAGEGFDCAVRVGDLPDSSLVSVRLADNRRLCVATPEYPRRQ